MTLAQYFAAGRRENFCLAPPHPSFAYALARRSSSSRATSRSSK
jgi:hypothetical protein